MTDADDRFLECLVAELAPLLGPRLRITTMDIERPADEMVRIRVSLDSPSGPYIVTEEGASSTAVAARLIERAPVERLADGFRGLIGQPRHQPRTAVDADSVAAQGGPG